MLRAIPSAFHRAAFAVDRANRSCTVSLLRPVLMSAASGAELGKRKMVKIGTHNGAFHCDEALGCFLLKQTAMFKDAEVVRTRDPALLQTMDVVIDVGGVYDPSALRFDHHQREFQDVFGHGFNTRLSSAGLVYKHFGQEIVAGILGLPLDSPDVHTVWLAVYKSFMEAVDAIDNGVNQWQGDQTLRYINNTHLSARVGQLNPSWIEDSSDEARLQRFQSAMALTGAEFMDAVNYYGKVWLPARQFVKDALATRLEVDPSGQIILLPEAGVPWKEHLYELEQQLALPKPVIYCLYKDGSEGKYRIQAVSASPGSFESRKALPTPWRGLRDGALSAECGIPGGVFVHASGFIGGNCTYEGALAMARKALAFGEGMTPELVAIST